MRTIKLLCLPVVCFLSLFLVYSNISLNASAVSELEYMSVLDTVALLGNTLSGRVLDYATGDWVDVEFQYSYSGRLNPGDYNFDADYLQDRLYVQYNAGIPQSVTLGNASDRRYQVDINIQASNVTYFDMPILTWCDLGTVNNTAYSVAAQTSYFDFYTGISGSFSSVPVESNTNGDHPARMRVDGGYSPGCMYFRPLQTGVTPTDIILSTIQAGYYYEEGNVCRIYFAVPQVNDDIDISTYQPDIPVDWGDGQSVGNASGTIVDDGNGTQNINFTVNTDNSGLLSGLLNGIRNLFVPSDEQIESFTEDMQDEFSEHLGGLNDIWELLDEQAEYLSAATSTNYVYFPELEIPIDGEDYTIIQGQQVELKPANTSSGLSVLWEAVALAVDIVSVLAVLNMLQTKYEIFLNPDGEVITYDS